MKDSIKLTGKAADDFVRAAMQESEPPYGSTHRCDYWCAPHPRCTESATHKLVWGFGRPNYFCDLHASAMERLGGLKLVTIH